MKIANCRKPGRPKNTNELQPPRCGILFADSCEEDEDDTDALLNLSDSVVVADVVPVLKKKAGRPKKVVEPSISRDIAIQGASLLQAELTNASVPKKRKRSPALATKIVKKIK